jgi:hypothetical protein
MNFGSLQIATLWRLSKAGVACDGLVVDGVKELRLIVTEGGHIVHWERFPTAAMLRRRAIAMLRQRRRGGWRTAVGQTVEGGPAGLAVAVDSKRRSARSVQRRLHPGPRSVTAAD